MSTKLAHEKVVILGAHPDASRYAGKAAQLLVHYGHEIVPVGKRAGETAGVPILRELPEFGPGEIDTVTLYINPTIQEEYKEAVLRMKPKRVIFNPGTENPSWAGELAEAGIEPDHACTLVLLSTNQF